jgi:hypothetical protein
MYGNRSVTYVVYVRVWFDFVFAVLRFSRNERLWLMRIIVFYQLMIYVTL